MENQTEATETKATEKTKAEKTKAMELLAGSEANLEAVMNHYDYLEGFIAKYLEKAEKEKGISFDSYISDIFALDLLLNDMATFLGHVKITGSSILAKFMKGELNEEEQNRAFMKMIKIEKDLPKMIDEDFYEVILEKSVNILLEKAKEEGFENIVTYKGEDDVQSSEQ